MIIVLLLHDDQWLQGIFIINVQIEGLLIPSFQSGLLITLLAFPTKAGFLCQIYVGGVVPLYFTVNAEGTLSWSEQWVSSMTVS